MNITTEPTPNRIAWLLEHNRAFAEMYAISQRIRQEEAENRAAFERKDS